MTSSRWVKGGPSPNPGGRPKSAAIVAKAIAEKTNGGAEIVERVLAIARGEDTEIRSERSRTWALEFLADRVWGRPAMSLELTAPDGQRRSSDPLDGLDDSALTTDEMRQIVQACDTVERLTAKARAKTIKVMSVRDLEQVVIDGAVAAGQTEEQAREELRRRDRELKRMPLAELERELAELKREDEKPRAVAGLALVAETTITNDLLLQHGAPPTDCEAV